MSSTPMEPELAALFAELKEDARGAESTDYTELLAAQKAVFEQRLRLQRLQNQMQRDEEVAALRLQRRDELAAFRQPEK